MIITPVQKVESCVMCPNFRRNQRGLNQDYICLAENIKIGSSESAHSVLTLTNQISDLCPFRKDEVNQRPVRGR